MKVTGLHFFFLCVLNTLLNFLLPQTIAINISDDWLIFFPLVTLPECKRFSFSLKSNNVWGGGKGEVAQTMHTHVSKCRNGKIKGEKKI
jgi:hypothetical protein